jgi:PTH1 family peptidyl-tRNA hydrolase
MRLLVGLGNPGKDYRLNRHNIGFMALDIIAGRYGLAPWRPRFQAEVSEGTVGERIIALKPMTYMNRSGQAVGEAARFYKIAPEDVIVIYDEIELASGKVKVKRGGGSAGHNGIKSIDEHIGNDYWRVRLGVGRPETKEQVSNHVLDNFAKGDTVWLRPLLDAVADAIPLLVAGDENKFMTKVALATQPPAEKPPAEKKPAKKAAPPTESA